MENRSKGSLKSPSRSEGRLGRSAATGKFVMKPAPKEHHGTVSRDDIRRATTTVIAGHKK
jgi:hypothetical protein